MRIRCTILLVAALAVAPVLAASAFAAEKPAPARKAAPMEDVEDDGGLGPLFHASEAGVRARLGDPDVSRSEGRGAFWTYRLPHCALFLFFRDGPKGYRVSGASTGPRKRGESSLSVAACLASAVQMSGDER